MDPNWQNLSDPLFAFAQTQPDAPALNDGGLQLNYRQLATIVGQAAVHLRDLGIGEGDRVGVALSNSADHIILDFALLRLGATLVEMSPDDTPDAIAAQARKYGIRTVFTEAQLAPPPGVAQFRVGVSWRRDVARKSGDQRSAKTADQLETILLTTGSTGTPSGWVTTQRAFLRRAEALHSFWRASGLDPERETGNYLLMAPLRHVYFFVSLVAQFCAGGPVAVMPEFLKRRDFLREVASWDNVLCYATANMSRYFLESAAEAGCLLPNIRILQSGGQPLFAEEKRALIARVTPQFFDGYGTAGMGMISILTPTDLITRPGAVGRPAKGVELEIVDESGQPVPQGGYGRIRCRSASMSLHRCPEDGISESPERIGDGWYYPGDIGMLDPDGFIHLRGRSADVVRREGGDIFTPEIEAVLRSYAGVADAAVIVRKNRSGQDVIVAFIVKRHEFAHEALAQHCRSQLAPGRTPDNVYYMDVLPRLGADKVDRVRLGELAQQEAAKAAALR
jgi:acyl-CoA synthetase (AMP-forming)/AMP-acid ligase II